MQSKDYIILIHKNLTNKISSLELTELRLWLRAHPENRRVFDDINDVWEQSAEYHPHCPIDPTTSFQSLLALIQKFDKPFN